jgi:hypothetical protein
MEDAALIPVEERIHIETLRLLIENAKLRKILNDYSEGILRNSLAKVDKRRFFLRWIRFDAVESELTFVLQPAGVSGFVQRIFINISTGLSPAKKAKGQDAMRSDVPGMICRSLLTMLACAARHVPKRRSIDQQR